jgi:hypothetical protein
LKLENLFTPSPIFGGGNTKMDIIIADLYPNQEHINDLSPWEMEKIQGGYRRRRRNSRANDSLNFAQLRQEIDSSIERWRNELNETNDSLRAEFEF